MSEYGEPTVKLHNLMGVTLHVWSHNHWGLLLPSPYAVEFTEHAIVHENHPSGFHMRETNVFVNEERLPPPTPGPEMWLMSEIAAARLLPMLRLYLLESGERAYPQVQLVYPIMEKGKVTQLAYFDVAPEWERFRLKKGRRESRPYPDKLSRGEA